MFFLSDNATAAEEAMGENKPAPIPAMAREHKSISKDKLRALNILAKIKIDNAKINILRIGHLANIEDKRDAESA